jgi:hypothetical protein
MKRRYQYRHPKQIQIERFMHVGIMQAIINLYHPSAFPVLTCKQLRSDKTTKELNLYFELRWEISCREQLPRGPDICVSGCTGD